MRFRRVSRSLADKILAAKPCYRLSGNIWRYWTKEQAPDLLHWGVYAPMSEVSDVVRVKAWREGRR